MIEPKLVIVSNKLIIVGGATRNVGKTSYVMALIKRYCTDYQVVGLKIKTLRNGDEAFHGTNHSPLIGDYKIARETNIWGQEDTSKMLQSGAKQAFKIKTYHHSLAEAFSEFLTKISDDSLLIIESNALREIVRPDIFIMIKHKKSDEMKPAALAVEKLADIIVLSDGFIFDKAPNTIRISDL